MGRAEVWIESIVGVSVAAGVRASAPGAGWDSEAGCTAVAMGVVVVAWGVGLRRGGRRGSARE